MDQRSFILYHDMWEQLSELTDEEIGKITRATFVYHATGEIVDVGRLCNIVFKNIKTMLDRDRTKYDEYIEKQSENGKKGGRPKNPTVNDANPENPPLFSESGANPTKAKKADSASVSLSDSLSPSLSESKYTEHVSKDTGAQALVLNKEQDIDFIDHRNSGTQRIVDIIQSQVKQEGYLYDNNPEERRRATIIAKRQSDWGEFIKETPEEREEEIIRSIIAYSNQNEYSAKIRSAKDFHEKWKKVANSMKQTVKKDTSISNIPTY